MKRPAFSAASASLILLALVGCEPKVELPTAELPTGGVTFDFKSFGERRFATGVTGPNLLSAEWAGPFRSEKAEWSKVLFPRFDEGSMPGRYRLSFRYKMKHSKLPIGGTGGSVMIYRQSWTEKQIAAGRKGNPGRTTGGLVYVNVQNAAAEWNLAVADFSFNPDHAGAYLRVALGGEGVIEFKDVEVHRLVEADEPEVKLTFEPSSSLDGTFAVPQGQCGLVTCVWSKRDLEKKYHAGKIEVCPRVTGDFEILEPPLKCGTPWAAKDNFWNQLGTVLKATGAVGSEGTFSLEVRYEGKLVSNVETVRLFTVPAIHAQVPERYTAGFTYGGTYMPLYRPEARTKYMADCVDWGVRNVTAQKSLADDWHRAGVKMVLGDLIAANGYDIAHYCPQLKDRPADERFVSLASLDLKDFPSQRRNFTRTFEKYTCPTAVYEEKPFFKNVIVPYMREQLRGFDGNWANWEPYGTDGEGCFCTNCAKAFAKYLKVPEAEVLKDWPRCVLKNKTTKGRFADREPRFRSLEHAKLIRTLDKYVTEFTGGPEKSCGFLPGVGFDQVTSIWKEYEIAAYYQPHDYMGDLKWLEPWGPYTHWKSHELYIPYKGDILRSWCAAKDIRETVDREFPAKRPKLQSYPQGAQGEGWIVQPEWLEIMMDAFFLNRWESTCVYHYPRGYDARWWRAFANHVTRAAKYEAFVWDGTRNDGAVALAPVEEYALPARFVGGRFPQFAHTPMLQYAAYDLDGRRMVAVLNHWEAGEAFFRLSAKGLAAGRYAVIDEAGTLWRPDGRRVFRTAAELAAGVDLAVPAMRTRVFEIVPAAEAEKRLAAGALRAQLTADDVRARFAARRGALARAAEADRIYERENACEARQMKKGEVYR